MAKIEPEEEDFDPDAFGSEDAERAFAEGVRLFNDGQFKDAHEEFEKGWLARESGDADFYKGLVQACICLHHVTEGDQDGARKLYRGHRALLGAYLPSHAGLNVEALLAEMSRHLKPLLRARPGERVEPAAPAPQMQSA